MTITQSILPSIPLPIDSKLIPGFDGYAVNPDGRVFSSKTRGRRREYDKVWYEMIQVVVKGYPSVKLWSNGKARFYGIHTLILITFVGPCPVGMQCRHWDGDSANCNLSNLFWGTPKENQLDRVRHGTHLMGSRVGTAKLDESLVERIRQRYREVPNKKQLAEEFGVSRRTIKRAVEYEYWKHVV